MSLNRRVMREIKKAVESKEFLFIFDSEGAYGDKNVAYVKFIAKTGAFAGQTHIIRYKFTYGDDKEVYRFPFQPPSCTFMTPIWHTNIAKGGSICLNTLQNMWSPMYGIEFVQKTIETLLNQPNHSSPYNEFASNDCKKNSPEDYKKICWNYYNSKMTNLSPVFKGLMNSNEWK